MPPPDDSFALSHSKLGIVRDQRASSLSWRSTKVVIAATMRVSVAATIKESAQPARGTCDARWLALRRRRPNVEKKGRHHLPPPVRVTACADCCSVSPSLLDR
jgi:hypothetical protein